MESRSRLGTFFLLIGVMLLILFVASILGKGMNLILLLLAFVALLGAYAFRPRKESQESGRFGSVRRLSQRGRERREAASQKKQKK
jgi:hypothetical protein